MQQKILFEIKMTVISAESFIGNIGNRYFSDASTE